MSEYTFFDNSHLLVKTNPTITFSNGMVLWLAEKGETVKIDQYDWYMLNQADRYIRQVGKNREPVIAKPAPEDDSIFGSILSFLFGWMK